jgi:hypothetical protein
MMATTIAAITFITMIVATVGGMMLTMDLPIMRRDLPTWLQIPTLLAIAIGMLGAFVMPILIEKAGGFTPMLLASAIGSVVLAVGSFWVYLYTTR